MDRLVLHTWGPVVAGSSFLLASCFLLALIIVTSAGCSKRVLVQVLVQVLVLLQKSTINSVPIPVTQCSNKFSFGNMWDWVVIKGDRVFSRLSCFIDYYIKHLSSLKWPITRDTEQEITIIWSRVSRKMVCKLRKNLHYSSPCKFQYIVETSKYLPVCREDNNGIIQETGRTCEPMSWKGH